MTRARIEVVANVLSGNRAAAAGVRRELDRRRILALNLMSSPGSGKTTLLAETLPRLADPSEIAVLVGDMQTTRDAERLADVAGAVVQISTGAGCHLSADQVREGLNRCDLRPVRWLFIENIGNMVCPADFDLGEHLRLALLSTPEGDDKILKYPTLFRVADAVVLTKTDLADVLGFDEGRVRDDMARLTVRAPLLRLAAKTGTGLDEWLAWLRHQRQERFPDPV